jgi:hypothetical protein
VEVNVISHIYQGAITDIDVFASEAKAAEGVIKALKGDYPQVSELTDRLQYARHLYDAQDKELDVADLDEEIRWFVTDLIT